MLSNAQCYSLSRLYDLAIISYILAFTHFGLEALVFRTAGFGAGLMSPIIVACKSFSLMPR